MNIWNTLRQQGPLMILAPMEDVTDTVFRRIIADCGRPDLFFTEFTNCEGAQSVGQAKVVHRLNFTELERPIIAQVWGITPEDYYKTARLIHELGFDGIDINMGCPVKKVIKQGACSALINNPTLASEIFQATKEGASTIPVSIKTRIGFKTIQTEQWLGHLLRFDGLAALTVHGRTVKELSKTANHWEEIAKAVLLRDAIQQGKSNKTLIIGNGDILTYHQAQQKINSLNLDGVMIGRGIFHNPWFFDPTIDPDNKSVDDKLGLLIKHLDLWHNTWGEHTKNFQNMKKYYKIYISGFKGASSLRNDLMQLNNPLETKQYLLGFLNR